MTGPRRFRRRPWLAGLALGFGLLLAIGLLEGVLRVFDPIGAHYVTDTNLFLAQALRFRWEGLPPAAPGQLPAGLDLDGRLFELKPDLDVSLGSFRLRTNALGCRGPAVAMPKPADVFRVVVLGDSVVFGWGVDEQVTFVRRLQDEWQAGASGKRLEVVNLGLPMYDTHQELASLREVGLGLAPDLVLLVYVVNDVEPTRDGVESLFLGKPVVDEFQARMPDDFWSWFGAKVGSVLPSTGALLGTCTDWEWRVRQAVPAGEQYAPERFGRGVRGWPRSCEALLAIRDACAKAAVPLLVLDHTLPAVPSLPPFCREHGIELAELRFSPADHALGIVNSRIDSHANARGHDLLLQRLRRILDERQLLPR